jgi:hypothetical protein
LDDGRPAIEAELRADYTIPAAAATVAVSLDGVMVREQGTNRGEHVAAAAAEGRKVSGPIGATEASVGAITFYDADGARLMTRRLARMPEEDKSALKEQLRLEVEHVRAVRPDLEIVAASDGAPNNWSFLTSLNPEHQLVDAFHALEHIKRRLDEALGVNTHANQRAYARLKGILLTVKGGHARVWAAIVAIEKNKGKYKPRKQTGRGAQPNFYERHHQRMRYAEHRLQHLPIGTGVVEGTARYMVVDRLRRTGMRWTLHGGNGVLALRQFAANNQFDSAWAFIAKRAAA